MALLNLLLLLLGLGVPVSSIYLEKRIIGGHPCNDNERHYHVVLYPVSKLDWSLCGGSLISDQWILTAAHCWMSGPGWTNIAYLGIHPKGAEIEKHDVTEHHIYRDSKGREHDIMLVKLPKPTKIKPIQLTDCKTRLSVGTKVQIAGFGYAVAGLNKERITKAWTIPSNLQCADIKLVPNSKMPFDDYYWYQYWNCASSSTKDTSPGDSGGGWVYKDKLYGVHAFTGDSYFACSEPAGFMDVCAYKAWIEKTINPGARNPGF